MAIDTNGDLFGVLATGTTGVFELVDTGTGYAGTLTTVIPAGYAGQGGSLVFDSRGDLFGTAAGTLGDGTVYDIVNDGSSYTFETLVDFNGADGNYTEGSVILDAAGDLFGATDFSDAGGGTVYEIVKSTSSYATSPTTLYTSSAAFYPRSGLVADGAGDLFGEALTQTVTGGNVTSANIVYELVNNGPGAYTFQAISTLAAPPGPNGGSSLVIDSNGDLFGVTESGGAYGYGAVFEVVKTSTGYASNPAILVSFYGGDGAGPEGLIMDAAGNLFGTTSAGGSYNNGTGDGTVFEIKKSASGYSNFPTVLANFSPSNGYSPLPGLAVDASGNLFGTTAGLSAYYNSNGTIFEITNSGYQVSCYRQGTRVATPFGERMVETLSQGDLVATAAGVARPIIWIGHRNLDCRQHPRPQDVWPVRVNAGAFGEGLPARDLFVSPDHAVFFDGGLIPIRHLINDCTIMQQACDAVTYWHIELAQHDVLLAEGLPCESYLDTGNRGSFAGATVLSLHPAFARTAEEAWACHACAPLVESGGGLAAARAFLAQRAAVLGWVETGVLEVRLDTAGSVSTVVPPAIHTVRLLSDSLRMGCDRRLLGALLADLRIDGASVALDDMRLERGFHAMECHDGVPVRWTDGCATVKLGRADTARILDIRVAAVVAMHAVNRAA